VWPSLHFFLETLAAASRSLEWWTHGCKNISDGCLQDDNTLECKTSRKTSEPVLGVIRHLI
jgi:hypothetical protein